ncbi:MAG: 16S rRNA (cytosine(967)-C(5))-methyltransferase RsmB [Hyphomicrobiaceae bacterium]
MIYTRVRNRVEKVSSALLTGSPEPSLGQIPLAHSLRLAAGVMAAVIGGRSLNDALAVMLARERDLPAQGQAAVQDLTYTALRAYGRGDFFLGRLLRTPLRSVPVRALLLVALARLEARPEQAHVTVDQAVEAAAKIAAGRFKALVNGLLRSFLRRRDELAAAAQRDEAARWRHPAWWLARLRADRPDQWESIAESGNSHPPMALRVNRRRTEPNDYLRRLEAAGIAAQAYGDTGLLLARPVLVERLPGFFDGLASVQDLGAQQAAALLDVRDGMRTLDACAAPGGKTAHLLELADLDLTALDVDAVRMERVRANLRRLGLSARLEVADCRASGAWWDGRLFDRILADVPCSASGVVRRHPDIKWLRRDADIAGFASQQAEILEAVWKVLAPGGKLLYATCSVFALENGLQVAAFAARHADCRRLPIERGEPERHLLPQPEHDGFYYALLQKRPEPVA